MSSFSARHNYYLFPLVNGKFKLGTGTSQEDAFARLAQWHTAEELSQVDMGKPVVEISQLQMPEYAEKGLLG